MSVLLDPFPEHMGQFLWTLYLNIWVTYGSVPLDPLPEHMGGLLLDSLPEHVDVSVLLDPFPEHMGQFLWTLYLNIWVSSSGPFT